MKKINNKEKCSDCKEMVHWRNMSDHKICYDCFESESDRRICCRDTELGFKIFD